VIAHVESITPQVSAVAPASEPHLVNADNRRASPPGRLFADLIALTKPSITRMVVATMFGGIWIASRVSGVPTPPMYKLVLAVIGTVLIVSGANTLNMYIERDSDRFMARTRQRPLPSGRMAPEVALAFGLLLSAIAVPLLTFAVNAVTGLIGAAALTSYVLVYTPLKRRTTASLLIGAVPGAAPPLLGWTAVTGSIGGLGLLLFGILFFWPIPHFLAIAIFRREDYRRAGLKILPVTRGDRVTRHHIVMYLLALLAVSVAFVPMGVGGPLYLITALVLGLVFLAFGVRGMAPNASARWARQLFFYSLAYLPLIFVALMVSS